MISRRNFLKVAAAGGAMFVVGRGSDARAMVKEILPDGSSAAESERNIPVLADVDLVVAGGSSRAVAAAVAAAKSGLKVFLVSGLTYLGDDICGAFLYDLLPSEKLQSPLAEKLYPGGAQILPVQAKKILEDALIDNKVDFVFSSYVTNVLSDSDGRVCGVVMANRSGRQAICAKAVIDATHEASVARMAGAKIVPAGKGPVDVQFTVVGGEKKSASGISRAEILPLPFVFDKKEYPIIRYTMRQDVSSGSWKEISRIEQQARSLVWNPDQVDSSDVLWYIPPRKIVSDGDAWTPKGVSGLFVFGPCADMSREEAAKKMRPAPAMAVGEKLGQGIAAAVKAGKLAPGEASVRQLRRNTDNVGQVKELLEPLRRVRGQRFVKSPAGSLPVLGRYDVVVLGGGTAGATAAISAASNGANTLVLEYLHGLGGISTMGLIGAYWHGVRSGFTEKVDEGVRNMAPSDHPRQIAKKGRHVTDWKMEWFRREILKAGGEIWFGSMGTGAVVEGNKVRGVVVSTPEGRGVVLSKVVIDSTGSADTAIAAGAAFEYTDGRSVAIQGAGLGKKDPGDSYSNNDWLFIDDSDVLDISRCFVQARSKLHKHYDTVKIPQTRERRRVVGEYMVSVNDIIAGRRYSDTISCHKSSFDTHGMIVDPFFILSPPQKGHQVYEADVPLRSLLPKGLDGILTTGLGASAHRDAMPVIRMQPCLHNQGYAAGYLSAMAVKEGVSVRSVDVKKVQKHLVDIGSLPPRVLTDKDFKGYSAAEMSEAADNVADSYTDLEILLTDPDRCRKLVSERLKVQTDPEKRLVYASILCMLGDAGGAPVLRERLAASPEWDEGWNYKGMGQFGMCMSPLDAIIIALGRCKDKESLPLILEKAKKLVPSSYFSHFRAVAIATESIASEEAAPVLAGLLKAPGMKAKTVTTYDDARQLAPPRTNDVTYRNAALKELHIARALFRCGDLSGAGAETLRRYAGLKQGHYARHASRVNPLF